MMFNLRTVVEITDTRLTVAQCRQRAKAPAFTFFDGRDITGFVENDIVLALTDMLRAGGSLRRSSEVILLVPRQYAVLRTLLLPSSDPEEVRKMGELQAAGHSPYSAQEAVVDIIPVAQTPDGFSRVISVLLPKEKVFSGARILQKAGLTVSRVTLSSWGILEWFRLNPAAPQEGAVLVVNIDQQISEIAVFDGRRILVLRVMVWGADELSGGQFDDCARQLELTLAGYHKEFSAKSPDRACIVSSLESDNGLSRYLSGRLGIPVDYSRVGRNIIAPASLKGIQLMDKGGSAAAVQGAAFSPLAAGIDLIPAEIRAQHRQKQTQRQWVEIAALGAAAAVCAGVAFGMRSFEDFAAVQRYESEIRSLKPAVARFEKKLKSLQELRADLGDRVDFSGLTAELYRILPQDISLLGLSISDGRTLSLQGYARNPASVGALQKAMGESGVFVNGTLDYVNKRTVAQEEFNYFRITCQIKKDARI
jgi:Tfp pilus assembly protein PilN